jgi:hypothetical protein
MSNFEPRFYRHWCRSENLVSFQVVVGESDLYLAAEKNFSSLTRRLIVSFRRQIENYIKKNPLFKTSLKPLPLSLPAPLIVQEMSLAAQKLGVGPMAGVAGAIAEFVGQELLKYSSEIMVENGGDIFIKTTRKRQIGIYAGNSPLSGKITLEISPEQTPLGICTSSGTVGHSFSLGQADAVVVVSPSTTLADVAATAIANQIKTEKDFLPTLEKAREIKEIKGVLIIKGDKMALCGDLKIRKSQKS